MFYTSDYNYYYDMGCADAEWDWYYGNGYNPSFRYNHAYMDGYNGTWDWYEWD